MCNSAKYFFNVHYTDKTPTRRKLHHFSGCSKVGLLFLGFSPPDVQLLNLQQW